MTDERRGLPSCSDFPAMALCPGKWQACRGLPEEQSDDADAGTRIHTALSGSIPTSQLSEDEEDSVFKCDELERGLAAQFTPNPNIISREKRLWMFDEDGNRALFSGKYDILRIQDRIAFLCDYKTGRNEVTTATGNMQLRGLAVLVHEWHDIDTVTVAVVQPWVSPQTDVCTYALDDLKQARAEILGLIERVNAPDAPRVPGELQCRYCRARSRCPEAIAHASQLPDVTQQPGLAQLPAETLSKILDRCVIAENIIDAVRAEAKQRIQQGFDVPGWTLKNGATRKSIEDVQTVFQRIATSYGVTAERFAKACGLAMKDLKELLAECGLKGKARDEAMDALLEGCVGVKQTAPSLVRAKE